MFYVRLISGELVKALAKSNVTNIVKNCLGLIELNFKFYSVVLTSTNSTNDPLYSDLVYFPEL